MVKSAFFAVLLSFISEISSQDPCEILSCSFDQRDKPLLCNWEADTSKKAYWRNGVEVKVFNHHTNIWLDADRRNVNMTRGHAEVSGNSFKNSDNLILSSQQFQVSKKNTKFHFKYWLATYGTSLKLCLDKPKCSKPLFAKKFDRKTKTLSNVGPLRSWRPCHKKKKKKKRQWDCTTDVTEAVSLPLGKHKLYFVASGLHKFSSIGVDSFHISVGKQICGHASNTPPKINDCFKPNPKRKGHGILLIYDVLTTGKFEGEQKNWDGSPKTCTLLCAAKPQCKSVVVYPKRTPPECLMYESSCKESPDSCVKHQKDGEDRPHYYEKCK